MFFYLPLVENKWIITLWGSNKLCAYYNPRKCEHVRYCHLELILLIILFLCGMLLKQVPYLLKFVLSLFSWFLVCERVSWCFAWLFEAIKNLYLSMFLNSYLLLHACVLWIWLWINLFHLPPRNISIHSLYLTSDNYIGGKIIDHIYIVYCS